MASSARRVVVIGGGTSGSVLAARLSEDPDVSVTVLEAGADDSSYDSDIVEPARAAAKWRGGDAMHATPMQFGEQSIPGLQARVLGGTSAINGMATLRGLPEDYDAWAAAGLTGWSWSDVLATFVDAEHDRDFGASEIHGGSGPLPVRRWRDDELSRAQLAFRDGLIAEGERSVADINDPTQLPGLGVFPVTIDEADRRVSTSLAYLTPGVRQRDNLTIRTGAHVDRLAFDGSRAIGATLADGSDIEADEIIVSAGALWTPVLLMRSGVGPADHLADHGIGVRSDLPVGSTMSDHLGPGLMYQHPGERGGTAGPAQTVLVGASNGRDVDYHAFPIALPPDPDAPTTTFLLAVFLLRSSGAGSVRLGSDGAGPVVIAPPLPDDGAERLRHGFDRVMAWERSDAYARLGAEPVMPLDLGADGAVAEAIDRLTVSYGHMVGTCPMGTVLDAQCRVHGIEGLRVVDASVMPTIPSGNTYLGCVMVAERVAAMMTAERGPT